MTIAGTLNYLAKEAPQILTNMIHNDSIKLRPDNTTGSCIPGSVLHMYQNTSLNHPFIGPAVAHVSISPGGTVQPAEGHSRFETVLATHQG